MTIRDYIEENSSVGGAVIAYCNSGYCDIDVDLDLEIDEKEADEFETSEDYDNYYEEIETQKKLADELIEAAEEAYQCDDDGFEEMVNEYFIIPSFEGYPDVVYEYFDYDRFREDLLKNNLLMDDDKHKDDNYFYQDGYYFRMD